MKQPAADKLGHFRMGIIWFAVFTPFVGLYFASLLVVVGMAAKEIVWDLFFKKGTPETMDFLHGIEPVALFWIAYMSKDLHIIKILINILQL